MYGTLHALLDQSVRQFAGRTAVEEPDGLALTYTELATLSDRVRDRLQTLGVGRGDRVGIYLHKKAHTVATIFGILKCGAAYVPVDPEAPPARCAYILHDCGVKVIVTEDVLEPNLREEIAKLGEVPRILTAPTSEGTFSISAMLDALDAAGPAPVTDSIYPDESELAYILYTSGSTGKPKGVMLTHRAGTSYVHWCSETFAPTENDTFSSHAPFHFDLSILDIYVPLKHGARLVLIGEALGKEPMALAQVIADQRITCWYSVPSILNFMAQYGKLERYDYSALRIINFAGEVFPLPQFHAVKAKLPHPRYFNLFGPTETNVCTYYEVPAHVPAERVEPFPIGHCCSHLRCRVIDLDGNEVQEGEEGELIVSGAGILEGYWNLPETNARVFIVDADGTRWYRTGDLVVADPQDGFLFHGRRDRMVKRRGYRIELGEIEAGLSTHPSVREVAVVALPDTQSGIKIKAVLSVHADEKLSLIALKQFSSEKLPKYMIPDLFAFVPNLPRTSTDKIDYQALKA